MRIEPQQINLLKTLVRKYFGQNANVWLFGSRVNDTRRGGDYDFYLETSIEDPDAIIEKKLSLLADLQAAVCFEDEKIDLVVKRRHSSFDLPIYRVAKNEGIQLL